MRTIAPFANYRSKNQHNMPTSSRLRRCRLAVIALRFIYGRGGKLEISIAKKI
jgi:hypothetical protein